MHLSVHWQSPVAVVLVVGGTRSTGELLNFLHDNSTNRCGREGMYKFFMSLKQQDGSFLVSRHSEVDVRYATFDFSIMVYAQGYGEGYTAF